MNSLINAAFDRSRTAMLILLFLLAAGMVAYRAIPKEDAPDVPIPVVYVSLPYDGISPEDAERLLLRPMEKALRNLTGLKEMTGTASEGHGSISLEFEAGYDIQAALRQVRQEVEDTQSELPPDADEPRVEEINVAHFPVLTVGLSGPIEPLALQAMALELRDHIEGLPGVLEVDVAGRRDEQMEVIVDPLTLESYGIDFIDLFSLVSRNNLLSPVGSIDTGLGRIPIKIPGVVQEAADMFGMPVKRVGDEVVTFADVAAVERGLKDPDGFARVNGQPALTLEVKKRIGANILETIARVRVAVERMRAQWPESIQVTYANDKSRDIRNMLGDLENNVLSAIILVMTVIIAALGLRASLLVGLAIPGSFLAAILVLHMLEVTMNIVVLFSLILVVGMLVDGAIVVTELAERLQREGLARREAFAAAARRMAWPVIASTVTTLAVFMPLLFWPGMVGHFMKYLPLTVLIALTASLFMALVFMPVLGGLGGRGRRESPPGRDNPAADIPGPLSRHADPGPLSRHADPGPLSRHADPGPLSGDADPTPPASAPRPADSVADPVAGHIATMSGAGGWYVRILSALVRHPGYVLGAALGLVAASYLTYAQLGHGVEFFPEVEPNFAQVQIHARGDLSVNERDALVREVESRILPMPEITIVYGRSFAGTPPNQAAADVIGQIKLEFAEWRDRRPAERILADVRAAAVDIPGIILEARAQEDGPSGGKPIQIQLFADDPDALIPAVARVRAIMDEMGGFADVEDSRPLPGIEWRLIPDRQEAARYGVDVASLSNVTQLVTTGIRVSAFRPDDADDEVEIRVRFPPNHRHLEQLGMLRIPTADGMINVSDFIRLEAAPATGTLKRSDGRRVMTIGADVADGVLADAQVTRLRAALAPLAGEGVEAVFKGEDQDQRETMAFLVNAFLISLFVMFLTLTTQFNSLYQAFLVMSGIVLSTAGVLLGLLISGEPFGIVMCGIGVIALAGIVVNNNIVLIDAYNEHRRNGLDPVAAARLTGAQRLRPVVLTTVTTVLGLMPMVLGINLDLLGREVLIGAPSSQWWTQLSTAIAGGLTFASILTLFLTPCLLVGGERLAAWGRGLRRGKGKDRRDQYAEGRAVGDESVAPQALSS